MLVRVLFKDGKYDFVKSDVLPKLIDNQQISRFLRTEGWVDINSQGLRRHLIDDLFWSQQERRRTPKNRSSQISLSDLE